MTAPTVIGKIHSQDSGIYSGEACKRGATTTDYADNYYDLGFRPEQVYIENVSGTGMLEIYFGHELSDVVSGVHSEIDPETSRIYRRNNHQYIAVRSVGGVSTFRVEAW